MMGTSSCKALDHLKVTRSCTAMTKVRRDNKSMATEEGEIKREVKDFNTSLYFPDTVDMCAAEALHNIAAPAIIRCGEEDKKDLVAQITLKKVKATLKKAPKGKAPGPDNLSVKVYCSLQAPLASEMVNPFNWCLTSGHQFPGGNKVKILYDF
ncbi:hypothetical protein DSO57_1031136 [Entomophthora muscae]|uniref:Uncharacterized protein n=1 Tax=Entomophthora muscae TaxID=34485 RepID=A0ACC2T0U1_9FUNG|nr:hypothetical protein DSO57_1031136 [Entomophthora muscae]